MASHLKIASRPRFAEYRKKRREAIAAAKDRDSKDTPPKSRSFFTLAREFYRLVRGYRGAIAFALGSLTIATVLKLLPPASTKIVIDYVLLDHPLPPGIPPWIHIPSDPKHRLVLLAVVVLVISALITVIHLWGRWKATLTTKRVTVAIRKRVFEHAARLPLHRVYQLKSGGAASLLREDVGGVAELIFSMVYNPWRAMIQLAGGLVVLAWLDWRLLLGSLLLLPAVYWSHRMWIQQIRPLFRDVRKQRQDIDARTTEAFGGMRVVRAFGRQKRETASFVRENHFMARQEIYAWWWTRTVEIVWDLALPLASGLVLLYGGWQVLEGNLTLGDLMMFLVYLAMLLEPLAVLATTAAGFQNSLAGFDRVLDVLAEPREMEDRPGALSLEKPSVAGAIALRGVSFHYPGNEQLVLRDINLEVRPGETIALVGSSGAGKTTFCNLVARFFDPTSGVVELDGIDLRDIKVESYRRLLGIVEQDVFLFDGTVAENIGYASRNSTPEAIEQAARVANAHGFIQSLPHGYDTLIGERGVRLSGGQRQRLAIARAVLADPRIFILDEATSNLDTESERLIQQSLAELMKDRTSFVIAHRLSTVRNADRILVLESGSILEIGSHRELMAESGRYRDMVHLQRMEGTL